MIMWGLGFSVLAVAGFCFMPAIGRLLFGEATADADLPCAFGYKMAWVAVRTRDTARLLDVLELEEPRSTNWSVGIGTVYSDRIGLDRVFVTPPVDGWSLVAGLSLPHPMGDDHDDHCTPFLSRLSAEFGTVQYYASLPELGYFGWAVLRDGVVRRAFACGVDGVVWNRGAVTLDERSVGIAMFDIRLVDEARIEVYAPCVREAHVLELARRWSMDPTKLDTRDDLEAGVGYLAKAPAAWRPAPAAITVEAA